MLVDTSEAEYSLVLQKLFPGITHYVKVYAIGGDSSLVLEKSKEIIVQTNAPPDTPVVGVRYDKYLYDRQCD